MHWRDVFSGLMCLFAFIFFPCHSETSEVAAAGDRATDGQTADAGFYFSFIYSTDFQFLVYKLNQKTPWFILLLFLELI